MPRHINLPRRAQEFLSSLSLVARGSLHDKIAWIFSLYDINHDGIITRHEMTEVVSAIYELLGHAIEPVLDAGSVERHVNAVFDVSGRDRSGRAGSTTILWSGVVWEEAGLSTNGIGR